MQGAVVTPLGYVANLAPFLLVATVVLVALFGLALFIRARVAQRHFNAAILPIAAVSHFLLSLGTMAALMVYRRHVAGLDQTACLDHARQQIQAGAVAVLACDPVVFELWRKQAGSDLTAYIVMSGILFGGLFIFYRSRFERTSHVQA